MASVQSNAHDGRYLKLTVKEADVNVAGNYSIVSWKFESLGGNSNYYDIYNWGVKVNNETIYDTQTTYWSSKIFPAAKGSREDTIKVYHKEDGSADPVPFELKGKVYNSGTETHSGSLSLTKINRYATFTKHQVKSTTEHTVTIEWDADADCDGVQYKINSGSWVSTSGKTYTISNLSPGTSYSIKTRIRRTDSQLWTESDPVTPTTKESIVRQKINGSWKGCIPYVKVNGAWKKVIPYIKVDGSWKEGIN